MKSSAPPLPRTPAAVNKHDSTSHRAGKAPTPKSVPALNSRELMSAEEVGFHADRFFKFTELDASSINQIIDMLAPAASEDERKLLQDGCHKMKAYISIKTFGSDKASGIRAAPELKAFATRWLAVPVEERRQRDMDFGKRFDLEVLAIHLGFEPPKPSEPSVQRRRA
jgi:hypothetical protein